MVITGMNTFGPLAHVEIKFHWLGVQHQKALITLAAFLTSLIPVGGSQIVMKRDIQNLLLSFAPFSEMLVFSLSTDYV